MPLEKITIEDDSDCETCTARHQGVLEFLAEVKCKVLTGIVCPECGREISIFVAEDD